MFMRKPKYRQFEYLPRYYNPDKDPHNDFRRKMRNERKSHRRKTRPVILWGIVFLLVVYTYLYLAGAFR